MKINKTMINHHKEWFGKLFLFVALIVISSAFFAFKGIGKAGAAPDKLTGSCLFNETKIDSIIAVMTLEEKIEMLCGNGMFTSAGVERLGIPELKYADGPTGIREELERNSWKPMGLTTDSATFFPTGSALAATWNPDMAYKFGTGIGEEAKTRGKDILLAPAVNITRTPLNGRTFEYMSEDPYLNSRLTVSYIKGVQNCGVAACVKHFAANNQETNRGSVNVTMDERTLREIYLPAFKAAIEEGHALTVMSAYNKFRGVYCGENDYLLNQILRKEWNFQGFVMSDWGGTHSTVNAALNGLEVEMGTKEFFTQKKLSEAVKKGLIPVSVIDEKVRRILRVNLYVHSTPTPANTEVSTPEHNKFAYDIALQSIVVLKNTTNTLPINLSKVKSIAVIGDNATHKHAIGGFGAGVKARYEITPLQGLQSKVGNKASISFVKGYAPKFSNKQKLGFGREPEYTADAALIKEAVEAAKKADIAIIFAGNNHDVETEATDRTNLTLPFGQDDLIKAVTAVNKRTIVVIVAGAPVDLNTTNSVANSIVWSWFNGSQGGNAVADILLGNAEPSGKLPFTLPVKLEDSPAHALKAYPGDSAVNYAEGLLVGYRWFDTKNIKPLFGFGHGLSYTKIDFTSVTTDKSTYDHAEKVIVSVKLKNNGLRDGFETVQLYVNDMNPIVFKANKELKAFKKVFVPVGKETEVKLEIPVENLAYYNEAAHKWTVSSGNYKIFAGASSQDIRGSSVIAVE
jgi:beta-glucosidase